MRTEKSTKCLVHCSKWWLRAGRLHGSKRYGWSSTGGATRCRFFLRDEGETWLMHGARRRCDGSCFVFLSFNHAFRAMLSARSDSLFPRPLCSSSLNPFALAIHNQLLQHLHMLLLRPHPLLLNLLAPHQRPISPPLPLPKHHRKILHLLPSPHNLRRR
jgi:hypothetical protein